MRHALLRHAAVATWVLTGCSRSELSAFDADSLPTEPSGAGSVGGGGSSSCCDRDWLRTFPVVGSNDDRGFFPSVEPVFGAATSDCERLTFGFGIKSDATAADLGVRHSGRFIAQLDAMGALRWTREVPAPAALAADASGNVYFAGAIGGLGFTMDGLSVSATTPMDVVLIALDPDGRARWMRSFPGGGQEKATALAFDQSNGRLVVAGTHDNSIDFGTGPLPGHGFLAGLTADGVLVWNHGLPLAEALALAFAPDGDVLVAGGFVETLSIAGGPVHEAKSPDPFIGDAPSAVELRVAAAA